MAGIIPGWVDGEVYIHSSLKKDFPEGSIGECYLTVSAAVSPNHRISAAPLTQAENLRLNAAARVLLDGIERSEDDPVLTQAQFKNYVLGIAKGVIDE